MKPATEPCVVCRADQEFIFEYRGHQYHRCPLCGVVSTYPLPDGATIEAHYARKFEKGNYQLLRDSSQEYVGVYDDLVRDLWSAVGRRDPEPQARDGKFKGLRILDIGCFTGDFLELLERLGADVYGLELQSQAVEIANRKLPGRIFKADVFNNDLPRMQFDIITMLAVIEHVLDPAGMLERVSGLLRPGGLVMLETPNCASFLARAMGKHWPLYAPIEHIHLFTRKSLEVALRPLGFEDIVCRPHWKRLPLAYVYHMLQNFGPEFHRLFRPFYGMLPSFMKNMSLSFYSGEMIVTARKM